MCRTIDNDRAEVNEILPELPAALIESGAIPVVGEVGPDGWIKWYDAAPAELQHAAPKRPSRRGRRPADPTPEEIRWMCTEIRAQRPDPEVKRADKPSKRRKAVAAHG